MKIASHFFYPFVAEAASRISSEGWKRVLGQGLPSGAVYYFDGKNCHIYRMADEMAAIKSAMLDFVKHPDFKEKVYAQLQNIEHFQQTIKRPDATFEDVLQAAMEPYAMSAVCFMPFNVWHEELSDEKFEELGKIALEYRSAADVIMPAFQEWAIAYMQRNGYEPFAINQDVIDGVPERAAERLNGWAYAYNTYHHPISWDELKEKYGFEFEEESVDVQHLQEVKGMSAFKGVARGPVRLVYSPLDFASVSSGDVLVTTMTSPQFAPIFSKVSAIVTDEGGITCHAAIIARELGKPCIIGTKTATKVFKDGDLVEVDAVSGIARRLS